jgi:hypothetical protein
MPHTIVEDDLDTGLGRSGDSAYLIRDQRCATCGRRTRGWDHARCERDGSGRLLVADEEER